MAKLAPSIDFPAIGSGGFTKMFEAQDKAMRELQAKSDKIKLDDPKASLVGAVCAFGAADGAAYYLVTKDKPLTLAHIPYSDAYHVPGAHIRGLTRADVVNATPKWLD